VYASVVNGPLSSDAWLESLRQGRTFATNGPLLDFSLQGTPVGGTLNLARAGRAGFAARLYSIVPLDHAQVVCNGRVVRELKVAATPGELDVKDTVPLTESGWCLLRAFTTRARYPVLDNFVYATTSPVYVAVGGMKPHSAQDARFFEAWIDHLLKTTSAYPDWNSTAEKAAVLRQLQEARSVYERLAN
jgi:hypothetical protein